MHCRLSPAVPEQFALEQVNIYVHGSLVKHLDNH